MTSLPTTRIYHKEFSILWLVNQELRSNPDISWTSFQIRRDAATIFKREDILITSFLFGLLSSLTLAFLFQLLFDWCTFWGSYCLLFIFQPIHDLNAASVVFFSSNRVIVPHTGGCWGGAEWFTSIWKTNNARKIQKQMQTPSVYIR